MRIRSWGYKIRSNVLVNAIKLTKMYIFNLNALRASFESLSLRAFHSSSPLLAINSEVTSTFENYTYEEGFEPLRTPHIPADGKWYITKVIHMHDSSFWDELYNNLIKRLTPGRKYAMLMQPVSEKGPITLGPVIHVYSDSTLNWLREYYEPYPSKT